MILIIEQNSLKGGFWWPEDLFSGGLSRSTPSCEEETNGRNMTWSVFKVYAISVIFGKVGPMKEVILTPDIAKIFHPTPDIEAKKCLKPTLKIHPNTRQPPSKRWKMFSYEID